MQLMCDFVCPATLSSCYVPLNFAHVLPAGFTHVLQVPPAMPLSYCDAVCPELKKF